ncbi:MAG: TolC family protein, partial [Akkermansiaceae bacterium]|nr:TolC family protein [Akkermansiaceae bacterium]
GFGRESNLAATDLARLKAESARLLTVIKAMNLVAEVAARYTDVVSAQKTLEVKVQNMEQAGALVERSRKLVDSGKGVDKDV